VVTNAPDPHHAHYELMADVFKSVGHPMRIRILEMLVAANEVSVGEFLDELGVEPSHLSHQLSVLRRQRLITPERRGNQVSYRLTSPEVADLLDVGRAVLGGIAVRVGDFLQAASDLPTLRRAPVPDSPSAPDVSAGHRREAEDDEDEDRAESVA
jgi:ArsR family transcriptional regulator